MKQADNLRTILKWLGTLITIFLFYWLIRRQNWETILSTFQSLSVYMILIVWLLFTFRIIIRSFRWYILLSFAKIRIPFFESLKLIFLGVFTSNFLPSTIGGDGIRFLSLLKFEKDRSLALSSIIIDRLVNVVAMISLLPIPFFVFYGNSTNIFDMKVIGSSVFVGLTNRLNHWRISGREWIKKNQFWLQSPKVLLSGVFISWIAIFVDFLGTWVIAINLGMPIKYYQVGGVTIIAYLVTLIPISINGYGIREVTITTLYTFLGFSTEAAISLAIITTMINLSASLIGALWLPENFSNLGKKIPELI